MLLSLFKIVFFIVIITLVALCITYLLDNEQTFLGEVFINIGTTEFIFSPIQTVIFLGLVIFLAILVLKLFSLCLAIFNAEQARDANEAQGQQQWGGAPASAAAAGGGGVSAAR